MSDLIGSFISDLFLISKIQKGEISKNQIFVDSEYHLKEVLLFIEGQYNLKNLKSFCEKETISTVPGFEPGIPGFKGDVAKSTYLRILESTYTYGF